MTIRAPSRRFGEVGYKAAWLRASRRPSAAVAEQHELARTFLAIESHHRDTAGCLPVAQRRRC